MITQEEIQKMTGKERLEAISMIWDSLDGVPEDEIESPDWHRRVLEERMRRIEAGEAKFYTLEQCRAMFEEIKARERPCRP